MSLAKLHQNAITTALVDPSQVHRDDWSRVIALGRRTNTLSRIAHLARGQELDLPPAAKRHLAAANFTAARQQKAIQNEIQFIESALQSTTIERLYLKGSAYAVLGLDVSEGRVFSDVDLIVSKDEILNVESALVAAGWNESVETAEHAKYFREWLHELPPMVHPNRGLQVDVHHNILPATDRLQCSVGWLFERAQEVTVEGTKIRVPCLEDLIIHSSVHLFRNGDFHSGLRDLHDILLLTKELSRKSGDVEGLLSRAIDVRLAGPVCSAQRHIQKLFPNQIDASPLNDARWTQGFFSRLQSRLADKCLVPVEIDTCDSRTKLWVDVLAYFPLPRLRTMMSPLFWLKRIPKR